MGTVGNPILHLHATPPRKNITLDTSKPRVQIPLPLHKPEYQPSSKTLKIKQRRRKLETIRPNSRVSDVLRLMDGLKLSIPVEIYTLLIKECIEFGDPFQATELHKHFRRSGLDVKVTFMNRLLLMFVSVGCLELALKVFDTMSMRDLCSWMVVIAGFVESGKHDEALDLFIEMIVLGRWEKLNDATGFSISGIMIYVLKACLYTKNLEVGEQVHGVSLKLGCQRNVALSNFLINFYSKLNCSDAAHIAFAQTDTTNNTVAWTSRIVNSCNKNSTEEPICLFKEMSRQGVKKNAYTFSAVLKACGKVATAASVGQQVHAQVMKLGLEFHPYVQCALIDLYGKHGLQKDAACLFRNGNGVRNDACCNAIITSYIQNGLYSEAMEVLLEMNIAGMTPSESVLNELSFLLNCD